MHNDLIWATCKDWQGWINGKTIHPGQPVLKNDKQSKLLPIEERIKRKTYAVTCHKKYFNNASYTRIYLPKSLDQVLDFLASKKIWVNADRDREGYSLEAEFEISEEKTWYSAAAKLLQKLIDGRHLQ